MQRLRQRAAVLHRTSYSAVLLVAAGPRWRWAKPSTSRQSRETIKAPAPPRPGLPRAAPSENTMASACPGSAGKLSLDTGADHAGQPPSTHSPRRGVLTAHDCALACNAPRNMAASSQRAGEHSNGQMQRARQGEFGSLQASPPSPPLPHHPNASLRHSSHGCNNNQPTTRSPAQPRAPQSPREPAAAATRRFADFERNSWGGVLPVALCQPCQASTPMPLHSTRMLLPLTPARLPSGSQPAKAGRVSLLSAKHRSLAGKACLFPCLACKGNLV